MSYKTTFSTVDLKEFSDMIELFKREHISTSILENLSDAYQIELPKYSLSDLINIAKNIEERSRKSGSEKGIEKCEMAAGHWFLGQKSLFFCVLSLYSNLKRINIQTITQEQLQPLQKIFVSKSSKMLMFEVKHLLSIGLNTEWENPDIQLLQEIMNFLKNDQIQSGSYIIRWKKIAYELFLRSNSGNFYSARDCRNKWMSHLSPNINKKSWAHQEQLRLWYLMKEFGCKWALISRKMGGIRTEHMVKNKANSIMQAILKKKVKTLKQQHIQKVIEVLKKRNSIKMKQESGIVDHILQAQTGINQVLQERQKNEQLIGIKRSMAEFEESFNEQRLILIPDSEQENWQYEQKPLHLEYSCFLTLN